MRYLSAFLVFSLLWACNSASEQKPRPESLLFKKSINAWQAKNDSGQVILWTNLEILGILNSDSLSQQINTQIQENLLLSNITSDLDVNSYEALHDSMALEFNRLAAQGFAGPEPWELRQSVDVVCNQNGLFGYQSLHSNYTGGVSASFYTAAQLFRISDGALLSLDSLVRPETWEDFLLLSESLFRQQNGMPETGDFETMASNEEHESVSKNLEYAYDDWCIAQFAKALGKDSIYQSYNRRAQFYQNSFDPNTGFMRAKRRQQFLAPFNPSEVNFNFTEANSWQYSFYAPHDLLQWQFS